MEDNNQSLLPPIFQGVKQVNKKKSGGDITTPIVGLYLHGQSSVPSVMNITMNQVTVNNFNSTKKNFPTIKKVNEQITKKMSYVSPYAIKSINK